LAAEASIVGHMNTRTDKFRPSVIDPTKFVFVAHHYIGTCGEETAEALADVLAEAAELMEAHKATHPSAVDASHKWPGQCDCCGAHYKFGATFYSAEMDTYIAIGGICAGKLSLGSPEAMKRFREQVNTWKVHQECVAKARAYLVSVDLVAMLDLYLSKDNSNEYPERTLRDMTGNVVRWAAGQCALSENQQRFARKLLQQIADRPRLLAERAAKDEARKPVPVTDKRLTIVGTIVSAKFEESGWKNGYFVGAAIKVVIEHADGWKVWGSLPSELRSGDKTEHLKGMRVKLDARVTPSEKDCKFGFFKRPTKASFITEEVV